jgi:hypothetical protein
MAIWTNFDGKITTHIDDHFSLDKAFKEFFDGDEASIYCNSWVHNDKLITDFDSNIEDEIDVALIKMQRFIREIKAGKKHFSVDINVQGRYRE